MPPPISREFEFHECLGRGGFGEVYRATMRGGQRENEVAVKLLHRDADVRHQAVERLRDEARILGLVQHPVVPVTWGVTMIDRRVAMVVEYVDGIDLCALSRISERTGLQIMERVASALNSAYVTVIDDQPIHVVHRDVKPPNVRLSRDGRVKLLDFGIARMEIEDREARTDTGDLLGSIAYIAPERLLTGDSGPAQDVYALGATMFEVMYQRRLFQGGLKDVYVTLIEPENLVNHLDTQFAAVGASPAVEDLLRRMLSHSIEDRPDAHAVACEASRLSEQVEGEDLKDFTKKFPFDDRAKRAGPLSGKVLRENRRQSLGLELENPLVPPTVLYPNRTPPEEFVRPSKPIVPPTEGFAMSPPPAPERTEPQWSLTAMIRERPVYTALLLVAFLAFLGGLAATVFGLVFAIA